jgi:hypothetical protein
MWTWGWCAWSQAAGCAAGCWTRRRPRPWRASASGTGLEGSSAQLDFARTASDGTFELPQVAVRQHLLEVSHASGYRLQHVPLAVEQEEVTVRLDPGARVEVSVRDRQGRPLDAEVFFTRDDVTVESARLQGGSLVQRGLEPGAYTVKVKAVDDEAPVLPIFPPQRLVVPARGRVAVDFQEAPGASR